jgi:hypothetical protein
MHRASRAKRVIGRGTRLRERDIEVLAALASMRLLSTSQITRLFFEAKGTCQKRMRKLFDAELVRPLVLDLAAENRYSITRLGHSLLERAMEDEPVPPFRPTPRVDRRGLLHLDLLNDVRIAMALGALRREARLCRFLPDWELRASAPTSPIIPDAAIVIEYGHRSWHLALEVDTGTESPGIVGRKLSRYQTAAESGVAIFGLKAPIVLIVTLTERRARTLARQAVTVKAARVVFASRASVLSDGGLQSGLSSVSDLVDGGPSRAIWSRGLLRSERGSSL